MLKNMRLFDLMQLYARLDIKLKALDKKRKAELCKDSSAFWLTLDRTTITLKHRTQVFHQICKRDRWHRHEFLRDMTR